MANGHLADGSAAVRRMFDSSLCRMQYDLGPDSAPWSVASFSGIHMLGIDLYRDEAIGRRRATRSCGDIVENPTDDFLIAMPFSAHIQHSQAGVEQCCEPGSAMLFPMALPFSSSIRAASAGGRYSQYLSKVTGTLLRQRVPDIDRLSSVSFDVRSGPGRIVKTLFDTALQDAEAFSEAQQRLFSSMLIDSIATVVLGSLEATRPAATAATSPERIRLRAMDYIALHLCDPHLDVAAVARDCGVSERYLHSAFAGDSLRVGACIREQRLQACRKALRDPTLRRHSITEIAFRWGFEDSAHFSHAYKTRFGHPPSKARLDS